MTVEVDNLFKASTLSAANLLTQAGSGFYIPAYQRTYAWKKGDISRLFEDVVHGLTCTLTDDESAITFLGTIILIKDQKHETINPLVEGQVPNGVFLVIDGQQRLTTIVLAATELYQTISSLSAKLKGDGEDILWFRQQAARTLAQLRAMFELDMSVGEGSHKFYPKVIRAFDDTWSWQAAYAVYASPVAKYLHRTITMERGEEAKLVPIPRGELPKDLRVSIDTIRMCIGQVSKPGPDSDENVASELPSMPVIVGAKHRVIELLGSTFPDTLAERLNSSEPDSTTTRSHQLFLLIMFARYLLDRVAFTKVTPKSEDYAFDVFESLNTTGEPLNAIETFKPRVISMEGLGQYEGSKSKAHFDRIEAFINAENSPKKRQGQVNLLLTPHKLSEVGEKMSRHLSDQRKYLKLAFERFPGDGDRRDFVESLALLTDYLARVWTVQSPVSPAAYDVKPGHGVEDLTAICLNVLQQSKHEITVAPLFRFYAQFAQAEPGSAEQENAYREFQAAVLAITAFFLIWRSTRLGTAGIDAKYRTLMRRGSPAGEPMARSLRTAPVTALELRSRLREFLAADDGNDRPIGGKDDYVKWTASTPLYENVPRAAQRLLLLLATHDTVDDPSEPGLSRRGSAGILPVLTWSQWRREFTVEHVAPQAQQPTDAGYDDAIYDSDVNVFDRLGNLTLLPQAVNSSAGTRPWKEKRAMYRALCSDTPEAALEALAELGITAETTGDLITGTGYLAHTKALAKVQNDEWSIAFLDKRGRRLAGLAWDVMAPWLGFDS